VRSGVYPEWLSDGKDASMLIEQSEAERIADKALERIIGEVFPEVDKNSFRLEETKAGAIVKGGKAKDVRAYGLPR